MQTTTAYLALKLTGVFAALASAIGMLTRRAGKGATSYSDELLHFTMRREGLRLTAYLDIGGVRTIGYGHTNGIQLGATITKDEAVALLRSDLAIACSGVLQTTRRKLKQRQLDALTDFAHNCGVHAYKTSHLHWLIEHYKDSKVPAELDRWDHDGKRVVAGLLERRELEAKIYTSGVYN